MLLENDGTDACPGARLWSLLDEIGRPFRSLASHQKYALCRVQFKVVDHAEGSFVPMVMNLIFPQVGVGFAFVVQALKERPAEYKDASFYLFKECK